MCKTHKTNIIERIEEGILGIYHVQKLEDSSCRSVNFTKFQEFSVNSDKLILLKRKR